MKWNALMFIWLSVVLMLCVPALGVLSLCLDIKLRQTLHRHNNDAAVDYAEINSREKTIFWIIFLACVCLRKSSLSD